MTDLKEQAKKIIAKGKALKDAELVQMGLDMLEEYSPVNNQVSIESVEPVKPKISKKPKTVAKNPEPKLTGAEDFTMNKTKGKSNIKSKSIIGDQRFNKFVDDKTEAIGPDFITPAIVPTQRRPPADTKMVLQVCELCGKQEKVHPIYSREFYRCEDCLTKGVKK